jgi:hypothetical protein
MICCDGLVVIAIDEPVPVTISVLVSLAELALPLQNAFTVHGPATFGVNVVVAVFPVTGTVSVFKVVPSGLVIVNRTWPSAFWAESEAVTVTWLPTGLGFGFRDTLSVPGEA